MAPRVEPVITLPSIEKRASASGFTSEVMSARWSYISGKSGLGELTSTVSACVDLWSNGLGIAKVTGAPMLGRHEMAIIGRSLATRGESVWLMRGDRLIAAADWDLSTRNGEPHAYRVSISEAGGATSQVALAAETLHFRIGVDAVAPWAGSSPLKRASLSASLLHAIESALGEAWADMPFASAIVPFPEASDVDLNTMARDFRGRRGRVLLRESVNVSAAGGPAPQTDWKPQDVTPNLQQASPVETLNAARDAIALAYGVLPAMLNPATTGPLVREGQRHLAQWVLQPACEAIAEECTAKLGGEVAIDCMVATQSFDAGGSARAVSTLVQAMAAAKEAGLPPEAVASVFKRLDWES